MNRLETFGLIAAQAERGEIIFPTSVNAALRLQLALDNPDCHIEDAIKLVLGEPQLAARTVALANSAAFNRNGEATVTNVRAAVMRIGYRSLQMLVASLVVRQFGSRIVDPALRLKAEQLWEHTAHVAALAQVFARRVTFINPDTALFAAIVHEVGGFYLLSRADEFPGLLDADPENWVALCEEVVSREVMRKLSIPGTGGGRRSRTCAMACWACRRVPCSIPCCWPTSSRRWRRRSATETSRAAAAHEDTALDFVLDQATLDSILQESSDEYQLMTAALMV